MHIKELHTHGYSTARNCAMNRTNVGVTEFKGGGNIPLPSRLSCQPAPSLMLTLQHTCGKTECTSDRESLLSMHKVLYKHGGTRNV